MDLTRKTKKLSQSVGTDTKPNKKNRKYNIDTLNTHTWPLMFLSIGTGTSIISGGVTTKLKWNDLFMVLDISVDKLINVFNNQCLLFESPGLCFKHEYRFSYSKKQPIRTPITITTVFWLDDVLSTNTKIVLHAFIIVRSSWPRCYKNCLVKPSK